MNRNLFAGGRSCLEFVKNAVSMKRHEAKGSKMRRPCTPFCNVPGLLRQRVPTVLHGLVVHRMFAAYLGT